MSKFRAPSIWPMANRSPGRTSMMRKLGSSRRAASVSTLHSRSGLVEIFELSAFTPSSLVFYFCPFTQITNAAPHKPDNPKHNMSLYTKLLLPSCHPWGGHAPIIQDKVFIRVFVVIRMEKVRIKWRSRKPRTSCKSGNFNCSNLHI